MCCWNSFRRLCNAATANRIQIQEATLLVKHRGGVGTGAGGMNTANEGISHKLMLQRSLCAFGGFSGAACNAARGQSI